MNLLDLLRFRLGRKFRRSEENAQLDEELLSHIQLRADDLERSGMDRAEATRRLASWQRALERSKAWTQ